MNVLTTLIWGRLLILLVLLVLATLVAITVVFILARRRNAPAPLLPSASVCPTTGTDHTERLRILAMVRDGRLGPEEADRLLGAMGDVPSPAASVPEARCPYCAESIPARVPMCPHCRSELGGSRADDAARQRTSLRGAALFLALYCLTVGGIILLRMVWSLVKGWHHLPGGWVLVSPALAVVAVLAGALMLRGRRSGWILATVWSAAQVVVIVMGHAPLNRQLLHVGMVQTTNGSGLGLNLIGIALVCLCLVSAKAFAPARQEGLP